MIHLLLQATQPSPIVITSPTSGVTELINAVSLLLTPRTRS